MAGGFLQVPRRILTIGPLAEEIGSQASALEKPQAVEDNDNECLQWLSKQARESVLYICFGTITAQGKQQMSEIAHGLESSRVHFLWVVRVLKNCENGAIIDVAKLLPEGFIERTKHRGLVYSSWAPQLQILAHPAVKGFLTHCGWNSIMEGIAMGVPMIAWPNYGDQMMNCRLCVDILNIAIPVKKITLEFEEIVGQDEVKRVAALLMDDVETAHFLKKNVEKLSKSMAAAHAHGGSSKANLDLFVDELNSMTSLTSIML
jgi:UDP:flavonoid glycosyltransferase YjiC (YdhE family)